MNDLERIIADLRLIESGELPDGDGVDTSVSLWAERWIPRLAALAGAAPDTSGGPWTGRNDAESLARHFHDVYERLAPSFGYETRQDTRAFDPATPNGRLMVAVCAELFTHAPAKAREERVETGRYQFGDDWPGVFLRGDYALPMAMAIRVLLDTGTVDPFAAAQLRGLAKTLESCDTRAALATFAEGNAK